jgi:hypothetical protein
MNRFFLFLFVFTTTYYTQYQKKMSVVMDGRIFRLIFMIDIVVNVKIIYL